MTIYKMTIKAALILLLLPLGACSENEVQPTREEMLEKKMSVDQNATNKGISRVDIPQAELATGIDPDVSEELLDSIRVDAANRGKSVPSAVRIITAKHADWPDGAMGCPEPGQEYTHAPTSGYHIIASVGVQKFDYRATKGGRFRFCDNWSYSLMKRASVASRCIAL